MKNTLLGNLLLALVISLLVAFMASRLCVTYPGIAQWMGGVCWSNENLVAVTASSASQAKLQHLSLHDDGSLDISISKSAIMALGAHADSEAREKLLGIVHTKVPMELRKTALFTLGQHGCDDYVEEIKAIALSNEPLELRKTAIHVLESTGTDAARTALTEVLHQMMPLGGES